MATSPSQVSPVASFLRQFILHGVSDTGRIIGNGSYATVKELEFRGLKCVGKKIHNVLFDAANPQERAAMLQRFTEECELLRRLYHPCVVQFLGVYFEHGSQLPVLVMEFLHTTLSDCLSRYGVLPEAISYGILHDVALGLRYLHEHSPPIIHRDLSANNVLLTSSMSGKISDLGVAKILNLTPSQMTQRMSTQAPGTPCYMPPEALMARPTYTSKIDSYSYGVMVIHVLCGRWPFPADAFRPNPQNPAMMLPVLELDRRAEYLRDIGQDHPLMRLISRCLSNAPTRRPEASEILRQIIATAVPERHQNKIEMLQHWEGRVRSQQTEIRAKQSQIESLTAQTQSKRFQIESLVAENQTLQSQNETLTAQIQSKQSQIESLVAQNQTLQSHNETLTAQTQSKQSQIESLVAQNQTLQSQNESLTAQTQAKVESLRTELERLSVRSPGREGEPGQQLRPRSRPPPQLLPRARSRPQPASSPAPLPRPLSQPPIPALLPRPRSQPALLPRARSQSQSASPAPLPRPRSQPLIPALLPRARSQSQPPRPLPRARSLSRPHPHMESQPILFHHQARLHWRKVANLPVEMSRVQVVVVGERVCVGGGDTTSDDDAHLVFQYDPASDEWTTLPPSPVLFFGLGQLSGELLTVGGWVQSGVTGKVYHYKPESQEWEEFLQPMPTARAGLTVISTQSALIACGGVTCVSGGKVLPCSTVEVYTTETSQWHTTDPLPFPCKYMSSATINNTGYLLGGVTTDDKITQTVLYAPVGSLIQRATSHPQQSASAARPDSTSSAWETLRDTPLVTSAAASLGGTLLAVGGYNDPEETLPAVHVYSPATSTWIRVESGDLPESRYLCTAIKLSANRLLVIGGLDQDKILNTVFLGSFTIGL